MPRTTAKLRSLLLIGLIAGASDLIAGEVDPLPIAGGDVIPPLIHQFLLGPAESGFERVNVEPNRLSSHSLRALPAPDL